MEKLYQDKINSIKLEIDALKEEQKRLDEIDRNQMNELGLL